MTPRPTAWPGMALRQPELGDVPIAYERARRPSVVQLQARDLEIMRALWRHDFLTTSQIASAWWAGNHRSRAQARLTQLTGAGLLARFRPLVRRGRHAWIYHLTRHGFRTARRLRGAAGAYVDGATRWTEPRVGDVRRVDRRLRVNGWVLAYRARLGRDAIDWRGPREAGRGAPVTPDAALLIELDPRQPPLELLVELARDERPVRLADRLRRYRDLLGATRPRVPAVVFVGEGYGDVDRLIRAADAEILDAAGARERVLFSAEPDMHTGSLRAWMLPPEPAAVRRAAGFTAREVRLPHRLPSTAR